MEINRSRRNTTFSQRATILPCPIHHLGILPQMSSDVDFELLIAVDCLVYGARPDINIDLQSPLRQSIGHVSSNPGSLAKNIAIIHHPVSWRRLVPTVWGLFLAVSPASNCHLTVTWCVSTHRCTVLRSVVGIFSLNHLARPSDSFGVVSQVTRSWQ